MEVLRHRADALEAAGLQERPTSEAVQRVDIGSDGELVDVLTVAVQRADVEALAAEIQSGVQR